MSEFGAFRKPSLPVLFVLCVAGIAWLPSAALAQDEVTVSSCPKEPRIPVPFRVDCTHISDPATKNICGPFIENQACKVSPAYRSITGIHLEDRCKMIEYTLYDPDKWPYKGTEAGGHGGGCKVELTSKSSLLFKSPIGPYDAHELLHVYQSDLGAIPYQHILFGSSMLEARRLAGDTENYQQGLARLKTETHDLEERFSQGKIPPEKRCVLAEVQLEETLYLENSKVVYLYYRKLVRGQKKDMADRLARFNRMFEAVADGKARKYLLDHGCAPF